MATTGRDLGVKNIISGRISIAVVVAALLSAAGCTSSPVPMTVPTALSIEGLAPSGTVSLTETFVGGAGVGHGVITFRGKTIPFKLLGTVIGPGSLSRVEVAGDVYKLNNIADFSGPYAQGTGPVGLETGATSNLWLQNKAGVIMHLRGKSTGVTLSLGRDEIFIEMSP
jgi:hypothetical protein